MKRKALIIVSTIAVFVLTEDRLTSRGVLDACHMAAFDFGDIVHKQERITVRNQPHDLIDARCFPLYRIHYTA